MANETVVCTYRVLAEREPQFVQLLRRHWLTLHDLGFVTDEQPLVLRQVDEPTYVEIFTWVEGGFDRAHEHPDVLAIWKPMDPLLEGPRWSPEMGVPALPASAVRGVSTKAQGLRDLDDLELVFGTLAHQSQKNDPLGALHHAAGR